MLYQFRLTILFAFLPLLSFCQEDSIFFKSFRNSYHYRDSNFIKNATNDMDSIFTSAIIQIDVRHTACFGYGSYTLTITRKRKKINCHSVFIINANKPETLTEVLTDLALQKVKDFCVNGLHNTGSVFSTSKDLFIISAGKKHVAFILDAFNVSYLDALRMLVQK